MVTRNSRRAWLTKQKPSNPPPRICARITSDLSNATDNPPPPARAILLHRNILTGGHNAFSLFRFMEDMPSPSPTSSDMPTDTMPVAPVNSDQPTSYTPTMDQPQDAPSAPTNSVPDDCEGDPVAMWEQCGGDTWKGSTCCAEGLECEVMGLGSCYSQVNCAEMVMCFVSSNPFAGLDFADFAYVITSKLALLLL